MATHVFTRFASYYSPAHGGVVDFKTGQRVDLNRVVPDPDVRARYEAEGTVELLAKPKSAEVPSPVAETAEVAETPEPPAKPVRAKK